MNKYVVFRLALVMMTMLGAQHFLCEVVRADDSNTHIFTKEISLVTGEPMGDLAVAGRLSVDLSADIMMSRTYDSNTILNWYNCGYSGGGQSSTVGGNFGDFGFQVAYQKRVDKYPHAVAEAGIQAARFDGDDFLKSNFPVEKNIAGARNLAIELWLRSVNPTKDDVIMGWQTWEGKEVSAPLRLPDQFKGSPKWRHLVVNCTPQTQDWYLDGVKISSAKRTMLIASNQLMVLGGATAAKPSFKGDLAAVRIHDQTMTPNEIAHNFQGGPRLGTALKSWWRTEPDKWFVVESENFRQAIDKEEMAKWTDKQRQEFEERVPGMFHLAELVCHTYTERLAMRSSVVSRRPEKRGDGIKYKTPIQPTDGGNYMGVNDDFGWSCQLPGFINPHELVHGYDVQTGKMQGNFWETHANFPQTYNGIYQTIPLVTREASSAPSSGSTYYHDRLMFEHLAQSPEYGPMFIAKLWYDGPTATDDAPYPWQTFSRLDKDPSTSLGYEWVRMVQRMVNWDYTQFSEALPGQGNTPNGNDGVVRPDNLYKKVAIENDSLVRRFARVVLQPIPYQTNWWRVPKEQAPQQLGWNICPLKFEPGLVSAQISGYVDAARGSDWRAAFVGIDREGKSVYGEVFGPDTIQNFQVRSNIKELYLVVVAAPSKVMAVNMVGDFRSFEQEQFPYRVQLAGCSPTNVISNGMTGEGTAHVNGGGFVANTSQVDATAYVGPNARVLGQSKVQGKARIEDFAEVRDSTVKDEAIVSDYALVQENSVVAGHAKVRDYALVTAGSTVENNARVLEHATLASRKICAGDVVIKGMANVYGGNQSGTAIIDGFYAKGNEITGGKWFTWSWGQGKNAGEVDSDLGGLYMDYDFENANPWMAKDAFAATWGYLVNNPQVQSLPDRKIAQSTIPGSDNVVPTLDRPQNGDENFALRLAGYLLPPATGNYSFSISGDDEAELWLGEEGSNKATRKLCSNPFWAGFRNYSLFSSQKSAVIYLEKGKIYPLDVLHSNKDQGSSLSVSWTIPGNENPEPIPTQCLSVTSNGKRPGVRMLLWNGVSSIADLVKRTDFPDAVTFVEGHGLVLNGKNQFVELPKDVADFRHATYTIEFKNIKASDDTRLFEFGSTNGDAVWLAPSSAGRLVFGIRQGAKVEELSAPAIAPDIWAKVQIVIDDGRTTLWVNDRQVAESTEMTLTPGSVRATQCYLGRGVKGSYFTGVIDSFRIHSRPISP